MQPRILFCLSLAGRFSINYQKPLGTGLFAVVLRGHELSTGVRRARIWRTFATCLVVAGPICRLHHTRQPGHPAREAYSDHVKHV